MIQKKAKKVWSVVSRASFIILGILSAGFGVEGFLQSSHFIDGGITGLSMLISSLTGVSLPILIFGINLPFLVLGYKVIGPAFAIRSFLAIVGLAIALATIHYPDVTSDKLLTAVFGGIFLGAGIGLSIRGGGVLDGTEILAVIASKGAILSVGDIILIFNIMIFGVAAFFLGVESAMYSILTYFSASRMVNFIVNGIEEYYSVTIISGKADEIRATITKNFGRGITRYPAKGGRDDKEFEALVSIVTRLEVPKLKMLALEVDHSAFIIVQHISDAVGGVVKRRALEDLHI